MTKTALHIDEVPARVGTGYPPPHDVPCRQRSRRRLSDAFGLTQFGFNLLELPPGAWSSHRHWHERQDEMIYVLEGEVTMVTDAGETVLTAGMFAGFRAGTPDGHHLINKSNAVARVLEMGTRTAEETAHYVDIDMMYREGQGYLDTRRTAPHVNFTTILVANRGEIAWRVMRTAKAMGYRTVAVYSDADKDAPHVAFADEAGAHRPAAGRRELSQHRPHPGGRAQIGRRRDPSGLRLPVGERRASPRPARRPGLVFIGPPPAAIAAMGNKAAAKRRMIEAGVPCVPGYQGADQSDGNLEKEARKIGLPVMVKAAAGGGGRGMRLVDRGRRAARGDPHRAHRGGERVRLGRADPREGRDRCAPCRDPGVRRCARQRHPSRRARLLGAAPAPEGDRGSALARRQRRPARIAWARRPSRRPGRSAIAAPARSSSCWAPTAPSTSSR